MERIDKIIKDTLYKKPIGKATRSAMICFYAEEWGKGRFRAISFSTGVLKLLAPSPIEAMELDIVRDDLIDYLNQKLKSRTVKRVMIKQGEGPKRY